MRLLVCALALLLPATAHATQITNASELRGAEQYRKWIGKVRGKAPLPDRIKVIEGTPCGPGGCAFPLRNPPTIALDYTPYLWEPGYESTAPEYDRDRDIERGIFIHELGHIWDLERGAKRDRNLGYRGRYRRLLGLNETARWLSNQRFYERWADAYASCTVGPRFGIYGYRTSVGQHRNVCRSLRRET